VGAAADRLPELSPLGLRDARPVEAGDGVEVGRIDADQRGATLVQVLEVRDLPRRREPEKLVLRIEDLRARELIVVVEGLDTPRSFAVGGARDRADEGDVVDRSPHGNVLSMSEVR